MIQCKYFNTTTPSNEDEIGDDKGVSQFRFNAIVGGYSNRIRAEGDGNNTDANFILMH